MTRTAEQNEQMREARKDKIRVAALYQFSKKGLSATRIQDIAQAAEMSQGLLYHYYPSKEAIYLDLIQDALDKTNQASLRVRNMKTTAEEKIRYSIQELFNTIETNDRFRQTCRLIAQATNSEGLTDADQDWIIKRRETPYKIMAEIFRQGQKEGSVVKGNPDELSTLYWTSVNGLSIYFATLKEPHPLPDPMLLAAMFLKNIKTSAD